MPLLPARTLVLSAAVIVALSANPAPCQPSPSDAEEYLSSLKATFGIILDGYVEDLPPRRLYEGAVQGLMSALGDPNSAFLSEAATRNIADTIAGGYGGIGIALVKRRPEADGYFEVSSLVEGGPAWRIGLLLGDILARIDGESTAPLSRDEVSGRLRGQPGSVVALQVLRAGTGVKDFLLIRELVEARPLSRTTLRDGSGYLKIQDFTGSTAEGVKNALEFFRSEKCPAIILDLRGSPGGLLGAAVEAADMFLSEGTIVTVRSRAAPTETVYSADSRLSVPDWVPIAVIIDKGTASSAEVLAAALRDNGRAVLVGERSKGKGSVQRALLLEGRGIRLTVSRYLTPSGRDIDGLGIAPDREVGFAELESAGGDPALRAALLVIASGEIAGILGRTMDTAGDWGSLLQSED
jgi:carboxyl-terminal processing protease